MRCPIRYVNRREEDKQQDEIDRRCPDGNRQRDPEDAIQRVPVRAGQAEGPSVG